MITAFIVMSWFLLSYGIVWFIVDWSPKQPLYSPKTGTLVHMLVIPLCYAFGILFLAALYLIGEANN